MGIGIKNNLSNNSLYQPSLITNMSIISPNNLELSNENKYEKDRRDKIDKYGKI